MAVQEDITEMRLLKERIKNLEELREKDNQIYMLLKELREKDELIHSNNNKIKELKAKKKMANWECLKTLYEKLDLRKYIDNVEDKLLQQKRERNKPPKWETFTNFASTNIEALKLWKFETAQDFVIVLKHLYQNILNDAAHPTFVITNDIVIPRHMFNDNQFRAIAFIWEHDHPIEKLKIGYPFKPPECVSILKETDKGNV